MIFNENKGINNLFDFYTSRCEKFQNLNLFNKAITYGEALEAARARAVFLQKKGFKKNDVIAILSPNSKEWCITYMAITSMGAIALPLDANYPPEAYPPMLKAAGAKAVFVSEDHKKTVKKIKKFSLSLDESMDSSENFKPVKINENETASLVFTSGTTGDPKIVRLTHANVFKTATANSKFMTTTPADVFLNILPLNHVYALIACFMGPMVEGSSVIIQNSLKAPDIIKSLEENPISIFPAPPQLWEMFFDAIAARVKSESVNKYRLFMLFARYGHILKKAGLGFIVKKVFKPVHNVFGESHRFFISGGAALKKQYAVFYRNMGFNLVEGYGLSETTGPIVLCHYNDNRLGSIGRPHRGNEAKLKNIQKDGIGGLWLRGDAVMPGYFNNDEATAKVFDDEGFFDTGDLGRIDSEGFIYLTGRLKNVIVLDSGKNIYPEEMEAFLKNSPEIQEIAVFGKKINTREVAYAVIVPVSKTPDSFKIIRDEIHRMNTELPDYKKITHFAVSFDPLPVNTARKIIYREVDKLLEEGKYQTAENDTAVLTKELVPLEPEEKIIIDALKIKLKQEILYANSTLTDFNIDSLGLLDFIVYLEEKLSIAINTEMLKKTGTLEELVQYLKTCGEKLDETIDDRILRSKITTGPNRFYNPFLDLAISFFAVISKKFWGLTSSGFDELRPKNNVIIANHQSYLDMIWIAISIKPKYRRDIYVIGKKKLSFMRFIFPMLPVIFIEQEDPYPSLKAGADILRQGKSLIIFPEGTRSPDGLTKEFKTGAAYLAKNLNKEIIPIAIKGAFEIYPRDRKLPELFTDKKGMISVCDTILPADFDSVDDLKNEMQKKIEEGLRRMKTQR